MPRIVNLRFGRAYVYGLVAMAFLGWGLYAAFDALRPPTDVHVRLAAGSPATRRFQMAETLATEGRKRDLFVEVLATKGFEESVRDIVDGKADLALVSSGLEVSECKDVRVLAGLDVAPLHILARRDLVDGALSLTEMVRGHRLNVGPAGTNDFLLASEVLRFLRLNPIDSSGQGDYTALSMSKEELANLAQDIQAQKGTQRETRLKAMPDVIMTVASLPGVLPQNILDTGEYCLVPFPNVEPFLMSELQHVRGAEGGVDRLFVEATTVHPGMYLGDSVTPSKDCPTIGLRTLLVTRADMPAAVVTRVMASVFESNFFRRVRPQSPGDFPSAYPIHSAAQAYLDRDKPLLTGKFFEAVSKLLSIFGAFSAGALSLYGYIRRRRIRRPGEYLEEIRKIDAMASGTQVEPELQLSPESLATQIEARLNQLKEQVIRDYCENRVQGEMVLLSILSTLADSRARLHAAPGRPGGFNAAAQGAAVSRSSLSSNSHTTERVSGRAA